MRLGLRQIVTGNFCGRLPSSCGRLASPLGSSCFSSIETLRHFAAFAEDYFGCLPERPIRRVVVTGLGLATPIGIGVPTALSALLDGLCGIRTLTASDLPEGQRKVFDQLPCKIAATIPGGEFEAALQRAGIEVPRRVPSFVRFALWAASEALKDADWLDIKAAGKERTGVAIGNGLPSTSDLAQAGVDLHVGSYRRLSPYLVPRVLPNMAAGEISLRWGLRGPLQAPSTACAAGANAIGEAYTTISRGDADVMVAGAAEACADAVALAGFARMGALATRYNERPGEASRPFDVGRCGFVLGEGAGVLVLEELHHALARGARLYAEVRGYGQSGDAHHITAPPPDGAGAALAMRRAMAQAGVPPSAVAYINAHATSTPQGDAAEARAIAAVFADTGVPPPAVSSTKGATGHLLGAAGAVEAVFTVLALVGSRAPPTLNLRQPDPDILPSLVGERSQALSIGPKAVLTNSFGFGGVNVSLLLCSPPVVVDELVDGAL